MIVNAYSTLREPPPIDFDHQQFRHRGRADRTLAAHLHGLMKFACQGGKREMTTRLYTVVRHLERVRHQFTFEIADDRLHSIAAWGWASNALFLAPDGTLRDPAGAVLVDPTTGRAQEESRVPFPSEAIERARRSSQQLAELGIPATNELPPIVAESETEMRSADDVVWRTLALFVVAVRAESVASNQPIPADRLRSKSPLAFEAMSPAETAFIHDEAPDPTTVTQFSWRYEALHCLQWALGLHETLTTPDAICDVPLVAETMLREPSRQMINEASLRPAAEILDTLDRNGRMLWAARGAIFHQRAIPAGLDGGVLSERQHALNWLVRFGDAPWDEVDTPT